jgi:hypothetical protein
MKNNFENELFLLADLFDKRNQNSFYRNKLKENESFKKTGLGLTQYF